MTHTHHNRSRRKFSFTGCGRSCAALLPVLALVLILPACGGNQHPDPQEPDEQLADRQETGSAARGPAQRKDGETTSSPSYKGRKRDGAALAVADPLEPELAGALPPGFPDDIPLGNWLSISWCRRLSETDFVLSCFTSYPRAAVGEFFVRHLPDRGWKLVSRSSKPILSVFTFRKDERAVTVMVKKQVMNQDVAFDISYKEN